LVLRRLENQSGITIASIEEAKAINATPNGLRDALFMLLQKPL